MTSEQYLDLLDNQDSLYQSIVMSGLDVESYDELPDEQQTECLLELLSIQQVEQTL
jgi:hypothetical protein